MTDHAPSSIVWDTPRIREGFIDDGGLSEYHDPINGAQTQRRVAGETFDTWLAAHDTEVAAKTLEDAAHQLHLAGLREKRLNRQRAYGRGVQDAARTVRSYAAMLRLGRTIR